MVPSKLSLSVVNANVEVDVTLTDRLEDLLAAAPPSKNASMPSFHQNYTSLYFTDSTIAHSIQRVSCGSAVLVQSNQNKLLLFTLFNQHVLVFGMMATLFGITIDIP